MYKSNVPDEVFELAICHLTLSVDPLINYPSAASDPELLAIIP